MESDDEYQEPVPWINDLCDPITFDEKIYMQHCDQSVNWLDSVRKDVILLWTNMNDTIYTNSMPILENAEIANFVDYVYTNSYRTFSTLDAREHQSGNFVMNLSEPKISCFKREINRQ